MAKNYASLAFTAAIKALQEKNGSRDSYARMEKQTYFDGITENEVYFISQRDNFYMATIGENGFITTRFIPSRSKDSKIFKSDLKSRINDVVGRKYSDPAHGSKWPYIRE